MNRLDVVGVPSGGMGKAALEMAALPNFAYPPPVASTSHASAVADNQALRKLLFYTHPCQGKNSEDGEMQCHACGVDFLRSPVHVMQHRLGVLFRDAIMKLYQGSEEVTEAGG